MGFWKKEGKTHFRRDEATGKVIDVFRLGDEPKESKTPVSKALMKQYYEKHPEERPSAKAKKRIGGVIKKFDDYSLKYAKTHQVSRRPSSGRPMPPLGSFSFDSFGDTSPKPKSKPQQSSRIGKAVKIDGKYYKVVEQTMKKKKKTQGKRRKHDPNNPFDFPDLW